MEDAAGLSLSVLLALTDGLPRTVATLEALVASEPSVPYEVVIVDDATTDGTAAFLSCLEGDVRVIRQDRPSGWAASVNAAAGWAAGRHLLIVLPGVRPTNAAVDAMLAVLQADQAVAAVQPCLVDAGGGLLDAGGVLGAGGEARRRHAGHLAPAEAAGAAPRRPDFATGACLLVERQAFLDAGGLDSRFPGELHPAASLGLALRRAGRRSAYVPSAVEVDPDVLEPCGSSRRRFAAWWGPDLAQRPTGDRPRTVAFYLPQFHPTAENDRWWGPGFTEWHNVVRAGPQFEGHHQPHLPGALGFYDLRLGETRQAQAALARQHGVDALCWYHYWFAGRRLLHRPLDDMLAGGPPDLPFCLCWANEDWRANWDGRSGEVLVRQTYSPEDDLAHIRWLLGAFADRRYLRVDGKPLLLVYRAGSLPDPVATTGRWRAAAAAAGLPGLHLARVESFPEDRADPRPLGFDSSVEFQPDWENLGPEVDRGTGHHVFDYGSMAARMLAKPAVPWPRHPCVTPRWDNTARKPTGAHILRDSSPERYEQWLATVVERQMLEQPAPAQHQPGERLVFVNAWNEWAEGAHLEPCDRFGDAYLRAHRRAVEGDLASDGTGPDAASLAPVVAHGALLDQLEQQVADLVAGDHDALAAAQAQIAGDFAWRHPTGRLASVRLEEALLTLAARLDPPDAGPGPAPVPAGARPDGHHQPAGGDRLLHVITEAHPIGGHTRLAWRFMDADPGHRHDLAVLTDHGSVPAEMVAAVHRSGGRIDHLRPGSEGLLDSARRLRRLAAGARAVVLHTHPYDPVPVLAFGARGPDGPPVLTINHADHVFWLGLAVSDLVAGPRPVSSDITEQRRGIPAERNVLLPVPFDLPPRRLGGPDARAAVGLPAVATVLLTVGSPYKYSPTGGPSFLEAVLPALERHPEAVLVAVGPDRSGPWEEAARRTGGRVIPAGIDPDLERWYEAADLYVESYPFGSLTASLEAMARGIPGVSFQPDPVEASALAASGPGLLPEIATTIPGLVDALSRLIADPAARTRAGDAARAEAERSYGPGRWPAVLAGVLGRLDGAGRAVLPAASAVPRQATGLDAVLWRLHQGTHMSATLEEIARFHAGAFPHPEAAHGKAATGTRPQADPVGTAR